MAEAADVSTETIRQAKAAHAAGLTPSQRAAAVVACCEWAKAGNPKQKSNMELGSTLGKMAEAADVSVKTIQQSWSR